MMDTRSLKDTRRNRSFGCQSFPSLTLSNGVIKDFLCTLKEETSYIWFANLDSEQSFVTQVLLFPRVVFLTTLYLALHHKALLFSPLIKSAF